MSDDLEAWSRKGRKAARPRRDKLSGEERRALVKLRAEAKKAGAHLMNFGKSDLRPSFLLGVMRRDEFRCKHCGGAGGLAVYHRAGVVASKWLSLLGHENTRDDIVTMCERCNGPVPAGSRSADVAAPRARIREDERSTYLCPKCQKCLSQQELDHTMCRACAEKDMAKRLGAGLLDLPADWYDNTPDRGPQ